MIINSVNFNCITEAERYVINPQRIHFCVEEKYSLSMRINCTLKATALVLNNIDSLSYINFTCVDPQHQDRFCANVNDVFRISSSQLKSTQCTDGNVLIRIHTECCHACGLMSANCWEEYTGHYVCAKCVRLKAKAPYHYGVTEKKCCMENGCGSLTQLYSEKNTDVYNRVLSIYDRYKE